METYAGTLEKESQALVTEYNNKVAALEKAPATQTDAMKQLQIKEIQEIQKRIQDYEQIARERIVAKQNELLKPVYDKARKAIEDVAKEKGYTYVIDNSGGSLLVSPLPMTSWLPLKPSWAYPLTLLPPLPPQADNSIHH